jgi:uncharacterized protein (PEP-CTERM system associated)
MKKNIYGKLLYFWAIVLFSSQSNSQENASSADAGGASRTTSIVPRVSVTEYFTDNYYLTSSNKISGWTTDISPGVHFTSSGGRVVGSLDYSMHQIIKSNNSGQNELQNALDATGSLEAVEKWAFVDVNGKISQRTISAFGSQSSIDSASSSNRTEVSSFRISPYVKGQLNYFANYEARYEVTTTRAKDAQFANTSGRSANLKLDGSAFKERMHWTSQLSTNSVDQAGNQSARSDSLKNSLSYLIDPQLNITGSFGREYGNYISSERNYKNTTGIGAAWTLSERTSVSADFENSYAGKTHKFSFEHRTGKSSWRFSDSKSVSFSNGVTSGSIQGNAYDLLFSQLSSIEPDPVKRAEIVNNLLLTNYGGSYSSILSGYLTAGTSIQRSQDFSFSISGLRDTVTFTAMQNVGRVLSQSSIGLGNSDSASVITQRAITIGLTHRLDPVTALTVQVSGQKNTSEDSSLMSNLKYVSVDASSKINLKTMVNLGFRRTIYSNIISPYGVNSINGGLTVQF